MQVGGGFVALEEEAGDHIQDRVAHAVQESIAGIVRHMVVGVVAFGQKESCACEHFRHDWGGGVAVVVGDLARHERILK